VRAEIPRFLWRPGDRQSRAPPCREGEPPHLRGNVARTLAALTEGSLGEECAYHVGFG
jgi:hypothetical protein